MSNDFIPKPDRKRTQRQNAASHVYFKEAADLLNEQGVSVRVILDTLEVDFSKELVKAVWQAIGMRKFGTPHTSELTTRQLMDVYEEFNRAIGAEGCHMPFPTFESTDSYLNSFNQ